MNQEALDRLVRLLDADPERAGHKYDTIRNKLTSFFRWRGCRTPEEYARKTIEQAARGLIEGVRLPIQNPYLYFQTVAIKVLQEYSSEPDSCRISPEHTDATGAVATAVEASEPEDEVAEWEWLLRCLRECLSDLPPDDRALIMDYHNGRQLSKDARKALARSLGIPQHALRLRAFKIRGGLESSVSNCVGRSK